jgi:uncharacterized protein YegJ (DUF2314 family)
MLNFIKSLFSRRKEETFIKREGHQQDILMVADVNKKMDDPHNVRGYQMRQTVRVTPDKITDWAYDDNGEMIGGGYTQIILQEMYGDSG